MPCYLETTFCSVSASCAHTACERQLTDAVRASAVAANLPIALSDLSRVCPLGFKAIDDRMKCPTCGWRESRGAVSQHRAAYCCIGCNSTRLSEYVEVEP